VLLVLNFVGSPIHPLGALKNSYHLEQNIDVVGDKGLSCVENQSLQHGGKPNDGNTYVFKCKYLQLSFLLCLE
jgi:hypothetical protein